ncbi:MAG: hypothetical protein K2M44_05915 [Clostridia bacterium]|nr:hypothetical protein [Clostridia bacterium]
MKYTTLGAISRDTAMKLEQFTSLNTQTLAFDASQGVCSFYAAAGDVRCVCIGEGITLSLDGETAVAAADGAGVVALQAARTGSHKLTVTGSGAIIIICRGGLYQ